jgi:EAL domain-containing protein (putative c-di-GMP-specific phosphodiesterase class I)
VAGSKANARSLRSGVNLSAVIDLSRSRRLRNERDRFVAFAFAAADLLLEIDANHIICFASGATFSLTKHSAEELIGLSLFELLAPRERAMVRILLQSLGRGGRLSPVPVQLANVEGSVAVLGGCRLPTQHGFCYLTFGLPVPSMATGDSAKRDTETGLLDKAAFTELATSRLDTDRPAKLTLLNLGGLENLRSRVDDEVSAGLLAAVGRHLRARSVGGDAAGRLGDGRFGVLHEDTIDPDLLNRQIGEITACADPLGEGLGVQTSTLSLDRDGISQADAARVLVYAINSFATSKNAELTIPSLAEGVRHILSDTAAKLKALRSELAGQRFDLAFQPVVSLDSRKVQHYEALVRFDEQASPAERVAFAEQVGLVADLDIAVLDRAIRTIEETKATHPNLAVAINLSGRSLQSAIFRSQLDALVRARGDLLRGRLLFEVTESALIDDAREVSVFLQDLRGRGFRICLDDFGSGAMSLDYLKAFAVDFVKIDGKYIRDLDKGPRHKALLQGIAELTKRIGTATIAEMIETEAQYAALRDSGIGFGQGYLFGKPGPLPSNGLQTPPPKLVLKKRGGYSSW